MAKPPKAFKKARTADEQRQATSKIDEAKRGYIAFMDATTFLRERTLENQRFLRGGLDQWSEADKAVLRDPQNPRPILSFNQLARVVNWVSGYQAERVQDYRAFPRGSDDELLGRLTTQQLKYAMDIAHGQHEQHLQFRRALATGIEWMEVAHTMERAQDPVEGDIRLTALPTLSHACDPFARNYDRQDAQWQSKLFWITEDFGKRRWPTYADRFEMGRVADWLNYGPEQTGIPSHLLTEFFDKKSGRTRVMERWYKVPSKATFLINHDAPPDMAVRRFADEGEARAQLDEVRQLAGRAATAMMSLETSMDAMPALKNIITGKTMSFPTEEMRDAHMQGLLQRAGDQAAEMYELQTRDITSMRVGHYTAWEQLDDQPSPNGPEDWHFPFVPFIVFQDEDDWNSIKSLLDDLKDPQKEINWHYSTFLDMLMHAPKGGFWVGPEMESDIPLLRRMLPRPGAVIKSVGGTPQAIQGTVFDNNHLDMIRFSLDQINMASGLSGDVFGMNTQKTVSGRAVQAKQSGSLVGLGSMMLNWSRTLQGEGELLLKAVQRNYSVEKMQRIIGQVRQQQMVAGIIPTQQPVQEDEMFAKLKMVKETEFDLVIGMHDYAPTARAAITAQVQQYMASGLIPITPQTAELAIKISDMPYGEEFIAAMKTAGIQPPNEALSKILGASQGSASQPDGVNK